MNNLVKLIIRPLFNWFYKWNNWNGQIFNF